jgi:putative toxin-antitoxin system antitoxin component (TIGR02293 family)
MSHVIEILGGERALKGSPSTTHEWIHSILAGLPARAMWGFKESLEINNEQLGALLGLSRRSMTRLVPAKSVLNPVAGDRLVRSARLYSLALDVFENEDAARQWLKTPQRALDNSVPLDIATTDVGAREVEALLGRIEHSVYT